MATARGGQIVASAATVEGLAPGSGVTLNPLGRVELRGILDPVALVEVVPVEGPSVTDGTTPRRMSHGRGTNGGE
jgi:class 3 adenylate cyclase